MIARFSTTWGAVLCAALVASGCAPRNGGGAAAPSAVPASYLVSRDGSVRYRMPAGWFDAGEDSLSAECRLWLMRGDYAGSLTVRPVHLQGVEGEGLSGAGLLEVAKLTAALETSRRPGMLTRIPGRITAGGKEGASYDLEYPGSGDRTRTVLLAAGGDVIAVTALVSGSAPQDAAREIFGALDAFLATARWEKPGLRSE